MKLSEYIEKYGDCEVTDEIDKCIVKAPKTVYDLKKGDGYFYLFNTGTIENAVWSCHQIDYDRSFIGNVFLTKEDAEFAKERLKVIAELKKYAKEFSDEEWEKMNSPKHYLVYDYEEYVVRICVVRFMKNNVIYFESEEKAKEAIEVVGEERIKKYYLGVKE